nr:tyrosine-type recombinase/integrase [Marivivens sp. JLT3646]
MEHLRAWEAQLLGQSDDAFERQKSAKLVAQGMGFDYVPIDQVAQLSTEAILERVEAAVSAIGPRNEQTLSALLGAEPAQKLRLSEVLEKFWENSQDLILGKSADQVRRWKNPRKKAFANFISVVGDLPVDELTKSDFLQFRKWWLTRIEMEGLTPNSANKDLVHLQSVLKKVNDLLSLNLTLEFGGQKMKEKPKTDRPPFSDVWIVERILRPGALDGLNPEARAILLVMINTGCRPSEIAGLSPDEIVLDGPVPYIMIRNNIHRQLKSDPSKRDIPLVGISLEAMRRFPQGFAHYRAKPSTLSATVNKYLRENGLLESEKHVMYSLRHSFEDRMLDAGIDDRIRRELFGHSLGREKYGDAGGINKKHELLLEIAL